MRVTFWKVESGMRACQWVADRGKRRLVPGPAMPYGRGLPHDLVQYVIEATRGQELGCGGLGGAGATFRSTGGRRTKPGRALIAAHRADLDAGEKVAGAHEAAWREGRRTSSTEALERVAEQWDAMVEGDRLVFEWPAPTGRLERAVPADRA